MIHKETAKHPASVWRRSVNCSCLGLFSPGIKTNLYLYQNLLNSSTKSVNVSDDPR